MIAKRRVVFQVLSLLVALSLGAARGLAGQGSDASEEQRKDAEGLQEFSARVQEYLKLQKKIESNIPTLKSTDLPEMITAHQQALARLIREARPKAEAGDIFTESARDAFRRLIRGAFAGPHADNARATMQQGDPLQEIHLEVNGVYPDTLPRTTVPPTLLAKFPTLPEELSYRIVCRDLVLLDVKSHLVVDYAHRIFP